MGKTVSVFIASSAELKDERDNCILFLNQINKSHNHIHLEPVLWEYDISHGSFPDFASVQQAINPLLEESALCVFLFYSKLGKYTHEEFALATALKKKLFVFFRTGFSPANRNAIEEWAALIDFKESLNETVLYRDYVTITDLELLLKDNLGLYLSEQFSPADENKQLSAQVTALLQSLAEKQSEIDEMKKTQAVPDTQTKAQLAVLEKEKQELVDQLGQSKEIQQQQAKDKKELELRLEPQIKKDKLKQQAFEAIRENKYDEAKALLKESAKESIGDVASTFYELGKVSKLQLNYKEALHYLEVAVKISPDDYNINVETGAILRDMGYNDKAIVHFEKAFLLSDALPDENKSNLSNELALAYRGKGEYDKAIFHYKQALAIQKKLNPASMELIAALYNNLGASYRYKGEYDKAIGYYEKSIEIAKKFFNDNYPDMGVFYNNLADAIRIKGDFDKAIDYYQTALAIDKKFYGEEHPHIAVRYTNIGAAFNNKGDSESAIIYFEKALDIDKKFYGDDHPDIATDYNNLGTIFHQQREFDQAIDYYKKALSIDKKFHGEIHPDVAVDYNNLGVVYYDKKDYPQAIEYLKAALLLNEKFLSANHPTMLKLKKNIEIVEKVML